MQIRDLVRPVPLTLLALVAMSGAAAAFEVSYEFYCYATHSDGIPIGGDETLVGVAHVEESATKTGDYGNYGHAAFTASISTGTISVVAHSHGVQTGPYSFPSGTGRVETCMFRDGLVFTVPPGDYPEGLEVSLYGRMWGSIAADVGAGSQVRGQVSFAGDWFDTGLLSVGVEESATIWIDESFEVTAQIVSPGTTLAEPEDYSEILMAGIFNGRTWSTSVNPGGGSVIGDGDISLPNGLRLLALDVPPGVTWVSESGHFPNLPTAAPDELSSRRILGLEQNHPNPFNPSTTIRFWLPQTETIDLRVFDTTGRLVKVLIADERWPAGRHDVPWRGRDDRGLGVASGVYFYCLTADEVRQTRKMTLVR